MMRLDAQTAPSTSNAANVTISILLFLLELPRSIQKRGRHPSEEGEDLRPGGYREPVLRTQDSVLRRRARLSPFAGSASARGSLPAAGAPAGGGGDRY